MANQATGIAALTRSLYGHCGRLIPYQNICNINFSTSLSISKDGASVSCCRNIYVSDFKIRNLKYCILFERAKNTTIAGGDICRNVTQQMLACTCVFLACIASGITEVLLYLHRHIGNLAIRCPN